MLCRNAFLHNVITVWQVHFKLLECKIVSRLETLILASCRAIVVLVKCRPEAIKKWVHDPTGAASQHFACPGEVGLFKMVRPPPTTSPFP